MKLKIIFFFSLLGLSGGAFCSGSEHAGHKKKNESTLQRKELDQKVKLEVIEALKINENLHSSFFDYDGVKVEAEATKMAKAISNISDPSIQKLLLFSRTKLLEMKKDSSREDNNQAYHLVSMAFIYIINKYDVGSQYNAYSCPMVKKKWLQNSKTISKVSNPYAPEMAHCGSQDSHH